MPRFYLHIRSAGEMIVDEEGLELPGLKAAISEAVRGARGILAGEIETGFLRLDQAIEIHDAQGLHVRTVPFTDTVSIVEPVSEAMWKADNARK
jgi:hypothetical protein